MTQSLLTLVFLKLVGKANNDLLDIGQNIYNLTGREKLFYEDQCSISKCRLSEEIDLEFEEEKQQRIIEKEQELDETEKIEQFTNPIEYQEIISITPTRSRKRRGL